MKLDCSTLPIVRLGQGDYVTDIWPRDIVGRNAGGLKPDITSVLMRETADAYHARRGEYLTSHRLAEFRRCPLKFRRQELGLAPDQDSAAYALGRAAHVLIIEGRERFEAEFAVGGPVNPKTGQPFGAATKAFSEWASSVGKPVISEADLALLQEMHASVRGHLFARELLAQGVAEGVVRAEYCGIPCQARIDWLNPIDGRGIVDLKTCDDLDDFERDLRRYGYAHQMAFYIEIVARACRFEPAAHLIAVEKREPYRTGVWGLSARAIDRAADENVAAIEELHRCRASDIWPTRYESIRYYEGA